MPAAALVHEYKADERRVGAGLRQLVLLGERAVADDVAVDHGDDHALPVPKVVCRHAPGEKRPRRPGGLLREGGGLRPEGITVLDQMDFHDYGHFHLLPKVTHASGTQFIEFVADAPTTTPYTSTNWGLIDNIIWEESFKSFVDEKENAPYNLDYNSTTGHFYGKPGASGLPADNVYPTAMPVYLTDVDASENGDWPMLDVTSRWKPKATDPDDMPYIFGQIAPQEAGADKKVFHDFRVYLYVTGATTPRVLTYRFYMHLKQDHATARHRTVSCK